MKVSDKTIAMIKHHEGVKQKPYRCPALLWTVGVGHVLYPEQARLKMDERNSFQIKIEDFRVFSMEEVDSILKADLNRFEAGVHRLCPGEMTQGQFDALVSFSFNVGLGNLQNSTLRMKHNRKDFEGAADEFLKWNKAGGKVLRGLDNRRKDERALYLS